MKLPSLKFNAGDVLNVLPLALTFGIIGFMGRSVTLVNVLASLGVALMAIAVGCNPLITSTIAALALLLLTYRNPEGFTSTPTSISATVKKLKEGFMEKDEEEEGFINEKINRDQYLKFLPGPNNYKNTQQYPKTRELRRRRKPHTFSDMLNNLAGFKNMDDEEEEGFMNKDDEEEFMDKDDEEEGFMNMKNVFQNISTAGYTSPGFGMGAPLVEGFEDEKKPETKSKPAPIEKKKEEMAMPFKLGEIPAQVKNGPHIDASSTLMKAVNSLNPEQINAMTKDTKQLIETQKSLMGMLGTMKPMMNDGKELMETFQEMFGKQ